MRGIGPAVVVVVMSAVAHGGASRAQQPTFRSGAAAVVVDVNVRDRTERPVTRLRREDFELFDNGVRQQLDELSYGKVPIDVTVALDISYSVTGSTLNRLRQAVAQLMRDLEKDDRLKLVLFNMRLHRTMDFTRDVKAVESAIRSATAGGGTALLDTLSVSLVSAAAPDRRQLIVAFTDGSDSSSTTTPETLTVVAERTRATLAFVMPGVEVPVRITTNVPSLPPITTTSQKIVRGPLNSYLSTLARDTGGSVIPVAAGMDLTATFRRVLSDFRSTYVLYYTPRGVERSGYHTIDVKVKREGATVRARRGYSGG
jgi:VWFA-related protein